MASPAATLEYARSCPDFVAHQSRAKLAPFVFAGGNLVAGGLWMGGVIDALPDFNRLPKEVIVPAGWFIAAIGTACSIEALRRMIRGGEHLRIGPAGVRCDAWSTTTIPWSEIERVMMWSNKGQKAIVLRLHNPRLYPAKRLLARLPGNRRLTGGDVFIQLAGTDRSLDEAYAAIEQFRAGAT